MKRSKEWKEPVPADTAKSATWLRLFMLGSPSFFLFLQKHLGTCQVLLEMNYSSLIQQTLKPWKFLTCNIVIKLLGENTNQQTAKEHLLSAVP